MKKTWLKVLSMVLVLCMLFSLAACGGKKDTSGQQTKASDTKAEDTKKDAAPSGEIDALLWLSSYPEVVNQIREGFSKKYPNIKVNLNTMTGNSGTENLEPRIASGNMPDVTSVDITDWHKSNVDKGFFGDISETKAWEHQLDAIKAQWTTAKGIKYGVSYGVAAMFIYYNKDLFDKAGIKETPKNWDEFLDTCEKLKNAGITPLSWPGGFPNMFGHTFISAGVANNIFRKDQKLADKTLGGDFDYSGPEWVDIFQKNVDLVNKGYVNKGYMSTDYAESVRLFNDDEVAMTFQGSWSAGDILTRDNVEIFLPPWNKKGEDLVGIMGGETGFGIGGTPNVNKELALVFFEYIAYENYANFQNATGTLPIYPASAVPGTKVDPRLQKAADEITALEISAPLSFQLFPSAVYNAMRTFGQEILTGAKQPSDVGTVLNPIQKEYIQSKQQ
jgi:multiple sugar transport system substrate-binding protein